MTLALLARTAERSKGLFANIFAKETALKPIYTRDSHSKTTENLISFDLYRTIFKPLLAILQEKEESRQSAKAAALIAALKKGTINYADGYFIGPFSASVSRELRGLDAVFDKTRKAYKLSISQIPIEV